jgi:acid phosphatase type 7
MNVVFGRIRRIGLACILVVLFGCSPDTQKAGVTSSPAPQAALADIQVNDPKPYPFKFVAYGDMRFAENASYAGKTIANPAARQQVIDQIVMEAPAFLVSTGDFVFRGFHADDWTYFDKATQALRDRGTPIYPAIGNHEVGPFPNLWGPKVFKEIETDTHEHVAARGLKNYFRQFPSISQKRWYSVRYANCYFLVLDSELADDASNTAQDQWIKSQLDSIPADVDYVFVALHRPPYTALTDAVHKPGPRLVALAKMLEARRPAGRAHIIVIAGHVHNYERYRHNGVDYIVSGGGGAAQVKFTRAADDLYPQNSLYGKNDPPGEDQYHYCVFTVDHAKLSFRMMKLVANGSSVTLQARDRFEIPAN